MNERLNKLYALLLSNGYTPEELGTEDVFRTQMSDSTNRKALYDYALSRGHYLGEYDAFENKFKNTTENTAGIEGAKTTESGSVVVDESPKKRRISMADTLNASVPGMVSSGYTEEVKEEQEKNMLTQEEKDQRAAMRQRLQEDGTIDRMKESRKEARRDKLRAFGSMLGSTPQVTSFGVSSNVFDSTDEQLADVGQALDAGTEYRQNKLLQEKLDVALDMARAGENQDGLRGVENFGLGLWDSATRLSTWDFGASDIVNNLTLQQIVEKWENDPSSLTATEQKVLEGIGMATAVQELYSDQVGIGYNVGQSLPESASFMMGMALNPASGLGKSLARNAVRTYGRNSIRKNLARIGGDIAETAIMTATTGAGRVAADALERINGSSTYEIADNGVIMYGGQKDQETVGNAVIKAIGSNFIENYSEALGEYFDPLLGMSRKVAAGGLRKMHLDKWADALSDVQPSQMTASIRALREKTKFGGIFGEVMEEEIGMALNTLFVGDNQWSDFVDLETQLTTVLSCAIMSGTLNGVEQVSSVAARRRMEKNAKNAEQDASYRFHRDEFAPLREAIDQASPEGMVDVLRDVYMSQEYTVGQKRALMEYAAARLQLQYYNAADAKARRQVNKTQQELLDAQEAGLNAQLPQLFNIARAAQFAEDELLDYDGDFNLVDIIRSSMNKPEEMERILGDLPPREAQLVMNYIYSRARMDGAYQGRSNRAEDYVDDFAYALEPAVVTAAEGNRTITTAIMGDRSVYVLDNNGDLAHIMYPDGIKTLVKASELTNITTSSAEEVIDRYRDMYTSEYNAETENAFEHHPKTQAPQVGLQLQSPEGEVVITAVNDKMVEIVPAVYKDGQVQPKEGAEPKTITVDDAYAWQDSYYQGLDDAAATASQPTVDNVSAETTENEGTPSEQIEQSVSEEVADGQIAENQPTEEVAESVAPAVPQTARERVPKDGKGNPIYEQTDADTAWDAIVEETEGDTEMAQRVAVDMLADKKAALAKLQNGKPKKGATVAEKIANEKVHQAAIAQAQNDVAQWEAIVGTEARRREAAMSEADRYAAEMEQKSINEGLAALGEPQSLEEYVLGQLAGGAYKLRWSDKENGTKGFGSHTGLSTEEMMARLSMIDNKNGLTPEEVAHVIMENMDASFGEVDVMDVTNMVIDAVATNASRRAMLNGMVESRAELMRQQARVEQEAKDAWYMEQYHATEEELAAYSEYLSEITEEIIANDANYEERFNTFAELIADEYDNQGTDADIRSSADQGERLASDREGSSSVGEGEETDRQGAVLGDAPRFAEAEDGRAGSSVSAESDVDAEAEEWAEATIQRIRELEDEIANIEDAISEFEAGERSYIVDAEITALEDRLKDAIAERDGLLSLAEENNEGADFKSRQKKGTPAGIRVLDGKSKRASEEYARRTGWTEGLNDIQLEIVDHLRGLTDEELKDFRRQVTDAISRGEDVVQNKYVLDTVDRYRRSGEREHVKRDSGILPRQDVSLDKIEELFMEYNRDENLAILFDRLRPLIEKINPRFIFDIIRDADGNVADKVMGDYSLKDNLIRINYHSLYSGYQTEQEKASTIVHEMIHAITQYAIDANERGDKTLPKNVLEAAKSLVNIYNQIKDNEIFNTSEVDEEGNIIRDYGVKDVHEMISELANPEFREKLKQIDVKGKNAWERIIDAIARFINQFKDIYDTTAYGKAVRALDALMDNFNLDAYERSRAFGSEAKESRVDNLRFREKEEPKDGKSLVGLHNISEEKLKKALKMGGLANPSMAVIDIDKQDHTGYGGITLVAPSSLIDKNTGKNVGTYTADAWTPIYPNVVKQMSKEKAYNESIDSIPSELRSKVRLYFNAYLEDGNIGGAMYYWFLHDTGRNPEMVQSKSEVYSEDELNAFEAISRDYSFYRLSEEDKQKVLDLYVKSIGGQEEFDKKIARRIEHMQKQLLREDLKPMLRQKVERKLQEIQERGYDYDAVSEYYDAAQRVLNTRGKLDEFATFRNAEDIVRNEGLQKDFEDWLAEKEEQFGVKEYIFTGYTNRGDRKYVPNTLANASKEMKKSGRAGATGLAGFNHYISTLAQNVGSLNQIRKKKSNLSSEEEYNAFRDKWGEVYIELAQALQPDAEGWADYGFYRLEEMSTVKNPKEHVKKEYGIDLSDDFMQKYNSLVAAIKNDFPARYFETKFERPVYLNEFAAAVVPTGTSQEVVDALKQSGLEVVEYEQGNEEARTEAVRNITNEIENIRFREGAPFFSNAERAVENIKQNKATPEQWLAMIKKDGGLKAGEDKWMGLSDWLNEQKEKGVKSMTKDEVLQFIRENQIEIEEVEYGDLGDTRLEELQAEFDELVTLGEEETGSIYTSDWADWAFEAMVERYGDDFREAFRVEQGYNTFPRLEAEEDYDGNMSDAAKYFLGANPINSTRLDYTTEGLDNKKEIALVVPTIESWNQSDEVHFGDAGEGRAVAWVRFGETTDKDGKRVLVIDEVQSKRHDEGRAKGYQSKEKGDLLAERDRLYDKMYSDGLTEEEFNRRNEINARLEELGEGRIPDAPFDKNYHELVMKRMLRYAAENGYDKVAWTKGVQQARRYDLGDAVGRVDVSRVIDSEYSNDDNQLYDVVVLDKGGEEYAEYSRVMSKDEIKKLFGDGMGDIIIDSANREEKGEFVGVPMHGYKVGDEGRGALYDEMIPRYMNKYTKKWGTKVGEVTLPNVEKDGRTMWSVDVTPEMRESVMQGQPMFREGMGAISDREVSYENDPIAKFQGKPRYYGKRAAAFAERERRRMENAAKEAAEMLGIEAEIITDASTLKGRKAKAKGWYDISNKKVVVVVPNHVSMGDAVRTVLHEGIAHHGLRELFGDGFDAMLDNVYNNVSPELKARIDAIAERTGVSAQVATEEYLASLAETTNFEEAQRRGWWQQIKSYFVDMLRKLAMPGLKLKEEITDNELRYLLWRSYKNLVEPNSYLKPLGYAEDVVKQKELKVGEYAEKAPATPMAADTSEAEEWAAVTMQRIEELEAQAAQLENEIAEMEAKREADDASRYNMWEGLMMPLRMQLEDVYAEIEGLYTLSGEEEVDEEEREAEKQRQLYQKRIDNAYLKAVREGDWEEATDLFRQYVLSKAEDEGIVPMDYGVGYRGGAHSSIAKKVKEENPDAIAEAAYQMSIRIPKGSILVPMPSRTGNATYTVKLAEAIAKATGSEVRDVLKGKARMSVYEAKQKGIKMTPEDLGMYTTEELPKGKNIVIIDNVIDKGTTALAAVSAVKGASVVAYAYTLGDKQRVASLKLAEPVTYDDNKRIIPLSQRFDKETDDIRYRLVDDQAEIERLESEPTIKAYRAMQVINGELYPPMSAVVDGKLREPIALGQWEQSEERPDLADDNGRFKLDKGNKKSLKAAYNPYFHSSSTPLNDQFSEAQDRDNLVTVEVEVPVSEADGTSGYKAEKAKDAVGTHQWKAGIIQGQLTGTREVFLTRWDKPVRIVPESEVADVIVEMFDGKDIVMPSNVVTPQLRKELEARDITFVETDNQGKLVEGENNGEHYSKVYGKKSTNKSNNKAEIIAEVERESAALGVPVRIARSVDELPDEDTRKRAVDGKLKGYFDPRTGEVVLYEPNTENANDAKRTILHEIVGHKGLRSLIGEQRYDKAMLQLMYMLPADVRDAVLRRAERHGWNAAIAMDEYLAEQAERDVQPTWWGKVNAKIRALLRNMGFNVMLTDADVTYLLWRSRKKLQGDSLNDMAVNAILKQAARKSAEAEAWNEQAFKDAEMRDFESNALPSIRHRMGADTNDYEKAVRTLGFKQAESWQDSMRSLLVFQQALAKASGKDIIDFENAYMYENRMSSANLMEMEQYRHMVYNPLLKEIHELEQMGASREDIINYLFAKSGLERNEVFARRDAKKHAEGDATKEQQLYDKYRQKDYAGLTALTRGDAQIAALVDDHSKKKTEYERLEQNNKRGVAVSDADLKSAKKEMNDARKVMITTIEAEAQRMVDEFERAHNTDNLWDKIRNCTHTTLNISHDAGVMSDEVYSELWYQFQYYIPLRGFAETTAEDMYLYLGGNDSPYNAPIKTAYGRTSLADDPIATIGNMAESAIVEANRNRLKQRFLYMVERHNTDLASISDVWLEYDDVNDEWHTVFAQIPDDATPSEAKRLQQEFEDRMKQLSEQNPGKYANASQQPNIPYRVVKKKDRQEHHVIVKRNGKDVVITINGNPRVAQAINGLTNPEQNQGMITRITSWINRNLSANFTMRNPAFMVSNFVRDGFYTNSMVWVKENPAYAWQYNQNWMKCTAQIASLVSRYKRYEKGDTSALDMNNDMDRMFYEFMINGGETGYTVIKSVEDYKGLISGEMKKMEAGAMGTARRVSDTIGSAIDTFGRWAEDTSRFAAYMTSRQLGRTITKSIWDAKEISVNFNKKGSGNRMMGKFEQGNRLNYVLSNMSQLGRNLYVFWNAGMQGLNNFSKAAKKSPAKFTAMAGTYFTLGVIVAAAFSGDDDEDDYYNLPEYVRRNNICFKIGKGKYATLPLPIEIRAIYGLGELAYSYLSGREGLTHGEAVTKTIQQITQIMPIDMMADGGGAMALVPSAAKPVVEVAFNVDWTGRPIYKEKTPWNQNDPTWTLAFKSTSPELVQMSRLVNEWTNKNTADGLERPYNRGWADNRYLNNPAVWEHIAEGYLGGVATMFNQTKKTLMMPFNEDLREVRNVPIASRFIKDAGKEGRSYAARNEYYDAKNIMDSWKNEMSKAKKEVLDESLTDEQRLKAAKLRSSLEQQYMEAAERWKVLDRQRRALEEAYKNDQSEDNRQALDDVMMQMATLVEAYRD